jgi:pyruvate/2-oxoacid:ferredoxin oxidoreductase alpha subunit
MEQRNLVSGDEAVALAALDFGIAFGAGYPIGESVTIQLPQQ